jgi:outer membrane biosynthesis protein TonB
MINWRSPFVKSICFHIGVVVLILLAGLDIFGLRKPDEAVVPIAVEFLEVASKNNIPKAQVASSKPKPKPTPPKPPKPKPKVEPKPAQKPVEKPAEKPTPKVEPKPSEKPTPKPKEEAPEKAEVKKEEPKKEAAPDELDTLLKSLEEEETEDQSLAQTSEEYDPSEKMTQSEVNAILGLITKQIQACWNVPAGARNAADLEVLVDVDIAEDGTIKFIGFSDQGNYGDDEFYQVAADSARRAVLDPRCNPLRKLPPKEKYDFWKELTIGFDPKNQIY